MCERLPGPLPQANRQRTEAPQNAPLLVSLCVQLAYNQKTCICQFEKMFTS